MQKLLDTIKGDIQKAEEHRKRYSASLAIQEMQIKTIMSYHYTHLKMAKVKITILNAGEHVGQPINCWWECTKDKNVETVTKLSCLDFFFF